MAAGQGDVACDGVLVDIHQAAGGPGPAALADVAEDVEGLFVGQARLLKDGALALGGAGLAGAAVGHADPLAFAAPTAEGEIPVASETRIGARRILATELFDGLHADTVRSQRTGSTPLVRIAPAFVIMTTALS
jgi:hypothetical protein